MMMQVAVASLRSQMRFKSTPLLALHPFQKRLTSAALPARFFFPNDACSNRRRALCSARSDGDEEGQSNVDNNTDLPQKDQTPNEQQLYYNRCLKGVGQVIFLNSKKSGMILLGSLAIGDPYLAYLATVGTLTSTITADSSVLGLDRTALNQGLWSYNGCLVGCATAVFLVGPPPAGLETAAVSWAQTVLQGTLVTIPLAAGSTVVAAALPGALGRMPQWTWAFNIVTLTQLLRLQPFNVAVPELVTTITTTTTSATINLSTMADLFVAVPLRGLSQIFVVESAWSGLGILVAIASYSPALALHALLGSATGSLTGLVSTGGAAMTDVTAGLWGFNSALTSMGIAVFMVHSSSPTSSKYNDKDTDKDHTSEKVRMEKNNDTALLLVSMGGAVASASVFGALQKVFGTAFAAPCLTLPFCITMSGCYLLAGRIPGLELAESPHSPERNQPSSSSSSSSV